MPVRQCCAARAWIENAKGGIEPAKQGSRSILSQDPAFWTAAVGCCWRIRMIFAHSVSSIPPSHRSPKISHPTSPTQNNHIRHPQALPAIPSMAASSAGSAAAAASLLSGSGGSSGGGSGSGLHHHAHHHHVPCSCPHISLPPVKKGTAQSLLVAAAATAAASASSGVESSQKHQQQQHLRGLKRPRPGTPVGGGLLGQPGQQQPGQQQQQQGPAAAAIEQTALLRQQALAAYCRLLQEGGQGGVPVLSGTGKASRRRGPQRREQQGGGGGGRELAPFTRSVALGAVEATASEVRGPGAQLVGVID